MIRFFKWLLNLLFSRRHTASVLPTAEPINATYEIEPPVAEDVIKAVEVDAPTEVVEAQDVKVPFCSFEVNLLHETKTSTLSELRHRGKFVCYLLEDGYNFPKVNGKTRIGAGIWECVKQTNGNFFNSYKQQFQHKFVILIKCMGFDGVLFHAGNTVEDTRGCPLAGLDYKLNPKTNSYEIVGGSSKAAYKLLYSAFDSEFKNGKVYIKFNRVKIVRNENKLG